MAKVDRWLTGIEQALLGSAILGASLILFSNVILRYFFAKGLVWAEELVRYLIIWMVFVGGSVAARQSSHINVDVLVNLLPQRSRLAALKVLRIVAALFCLALCLWGARVTLLIKASGQVTPGMNMPTYWAYLAIPVGSALMALRFVQAALEGRTGGDAQ
jgi:C4-dicarboxylate transporter, DctQ subunit